MPVLILGRSTPRITSPLLTWGFRKLRAILGSPYKKDHSISYRLFWCPLFLENSTCKPAKMCRNSIQRPFTCLAVEIMEVQLVAFAHGEVQIRAHLAELGTRQASSCREATQGLLGVFHDLCRVSESQVHYEESQISL